MRLNETYSFWMVWIGLRIEKERYKFILRNRSTLFHRPAFSSGLLGISAFRKSPANRDFPVLSCLTHRRNLLRLLAELVIYQRLLGPDLCGQRNPPSPVRDPLV